MHTNLYFRVLLLSILSSLLITKQARADEEQEREPWTVFVCCSEHKDKGYNGFNPGIGREWIISSNLSAGLALAINSHEEPTLYGDVSWKPLQIEKVKAGLALVCALGYDGNKIECIPPVPVFEYQHSKTLAFDSLFIPNENKPLRAELITLRIKRRF